MSVVDFLIASDHLAPKAPDGAAFMDERTKKDQRPRCLRIETAADQERNET
jgi:hypothetical protein